MRQLYFLIALLLTGFTAVKENDIHEWRGRDRAGIYQENNLVKQWPETGPNELWTIDDTGDGFVSPVFTGDYFYITGEKDSLTSLYCYNLDGIQQWKTALGPEWMQSYPGTRSAATIAGDLIYAGTGRGDLYCIDRNTGKMVWSKNLQRDFQGVLPLHGHSEAALVDGDRVFWTPGGKEYNVVALNRFTGEIIWHNSGFGERSAYNSPKLIRLPSKDIVAAFSAYHLMGFDAETGKLLWSQEQDNYPPEKRSPGYGDTHSNTILFDKGSIYYVEGDGNCTVRLDLSDDGNSIKEVWRNKRLDGFMGGAVKIGDYLYSSASSSPNLFSLNTVTGTLCDSLKSGSGALIAADNMMYYYTQRGEMILLSYDNGSLKKV
ncbi:MAG TPA: PQQ-binding-like beta-propeller repeat protein, partial [Bacteroidales bacterium]|nr:PQQ-binding-like beta-propeller repeat protein [Bacteroidales bacterium]